MLISCYLANTVLRTPALPAAFSQGFLWLAKRGSAQHTGRELHIISDDIVVSGGIGLHQVREGDVVQIVVDDLVQPLPQG